MTPIPKKHEQASTNRPISLSPVLSKVCKRVVHNQFSYCLNEKGRRTKNHSTNKAWHSTQTSVIKMTNEILSTGDQRKLTAITLLDLSKAKVTRCQSFPFQHPVVLQLSQQRCQVVSIHSAVVEPLHLVSAVPQGSILGPHLFSIYVNDLPSVARKCSLQCYVYNTKLLISFQIQDKQSAVSDMNKDLFKVWNWCFRNHLFFNPIKIKHGVQHCVKPVHAWCSDFLV